MAKFAISLCVLLVACGACQAQFSFSNLADTFRKSVTAQTSNKTSPTAALSSLSSLISSSPLSTIADVTTSAVSAATSGNASSGLSSITDIASSAVSAATSGNASSGLSSITDIASNAVSAASSGDVSSLLSTVSNAVSDGVSLASSVAGSSNGLGSLFAGITDTMSSAATSNPLLSLLTGTTTSWITNASNQVKTQLSVMMGVMKSSLRVMESMEIVAMDSISSLLGQFGNILDSFTNTGMNVDSCISIASGIQEIAGTAMINTTTCSRTIVETMETDFNNAITVMTAFLENLYSLAKGLDACAKADFFSMLACVAKVGSTTGAKCVEGFGSTLSEVTSIMTKMANVQNELTGCGMASAQQQVQQRILSDTVKVAQCVVELGQSGLSGASAENAAKAVEIANKILSSTISG